MSKRSHPSLICAVVLIVGSVVHTHAQADAPAPYLSLFSPEGQSRWTGLCKTGQLQSPIGFNTSAARAQVPDAIALNYSTAAKIRVSNEDTGGMQLNVEPGSTVALTLSDNTSYTLELRQIHWHHPGEHTLDNKHFDIETHLVHRIVETGKNAVFAILLESDENGLPDPVLRMGLENAPTTYTVVNSTKRIWDEANATETLNLDQLFAPVLAGAFAHYQGSLTTPPCTEGIQWFVFLIHGTASADQLSEYAAYVEAGNAPNGANEDDRPIQALHGRKIEYIDQLDPFSA